MNITADVRLKMRISQEELQSKVGRILTDKDYNLLVTGPTRVRKPDGAPLLVYVPGALDAELLAQSYAVLHSFKNAKTDNRGLASGTPRLDHASGGGRSRAKKVPSAIIGAFDPGGPKQYCRLTAFSAQEGERYRSLWPLFQAISQQFQEHVPERFAVQMSHVERTSPEWIVAGTPFTTITVNNSYATGVHTDQGDLEQGFSTLACLRYGEYEGGRLVFPEYRVAVDMQHGDVLLMDASEWHGNTALQMRSDDAERISTVCYFRAKMSQCGTLEQENARRIAVNEKRVLGGAT